MNKDDVIRLAKEAGFVEYELDDGTTNSFDKRYAKFAKLVAEHERKACMQLFLDPENQPTQFGTATQEYREQEIKEVQDLLTLIAGIVRDTHLYGPEMKKLLAQEAAIRARGEA